MPSGRVGLRTRPSGPAQRAGGRVGPVGRAAASELPQGVACCCAPAVPVMLLFGADKGWPGRAKRRVAPRRCRHPGQTSWAGPRGEPLPRRFGAGVNAESLRASGRDVAGWSARRVRFAVHGGQPRCRSGPPALVPG